MDWRNNIPAHYERKWWKEAVIYTLYIRSFKDTNDDGVGDVRGITEKLEYLKLLGVDVLWISPFHPSAQEDWGYDISDYLTVSEEMGTMQDVRDLLEEAKKRDIKVIMDLVVNHSSVQHYWFQESKKSKDNPYRNYYYWRPGNEGKPPTNWMNSFSSVPGSTWSYDEETEEYYLHMFTPGQPDLNWENPQVREEIYKIMRFWLDMGFSGFRLDASQYYSKRADFPNIPENSDMSAHYQYCTMGPRFHEFLQEMHERVLQHYDCMTVGELYGATPENAWTIVGYDRKELCMILTGEAHYIDSDPEEPFRGRALTADDFRRIYGKWHHGLFQRGWNAPWLSNQDMVRAVSRLRANDDAHHRKEAGKLLATILLTQSGTPYLYQGDELGMTNCSWEPSEYIDIFVQNWYREQKKLGRPEKEIIDEINYRGRLNPRTPMQWSADPQAGFSTSEKLWLKVNPNYTHINAVESLDDKDSIFYYYKELIALRKAHSVLIYGDYREVATESAQVYAYIRFMPDNLASQYLVVANVTHEMAEIPCHEWQNSKLECLIANYGHAPRMNNDLIILRPLEAALFLLSPS